MLSVPGGLGEAFCEQSMIQRQGGPRQAVLSLRGGDNHERCIEPTKVSCDHRRGGRAVPWAGGGWCEHLGKGDRHLEIAKANRDILKGFFGVLKGQSLADKLRLVFLTGVSRFSKVSLFSDLNNLFDLSMDRSYADMLGYTPEEN